MKEGEEQHRYTVYLSLGANLGDREGAITGALRNIDQLPSTRLIRVSSLYATEPVGVVDQPDFLNAAAMLETLLEPSALHAGLREIEERLGRLHRRRWGEREIDIDLLMIDDLTIRSERLTVPHPEMHHRRFVLVPLAEIAPEAKHPLLDRTIARLLAECNDTAWVRHHADLPLMHEPRR